MPMTDGFPFAGVSVANGKIINLCGPCPVKLSVKPQEQFDRLSSDFDNLV
jgi:hypothetical protein